MEIRELQQMIQHQTLSLLSQKNNLTIHRPASFESTFRQMLLEKINQANILHQTRNTNTNSLQNDLAFTENKVTFSRPYSTTRESLKQINASVKDEIGRASCRERVKR